MSITLLSGDCRDVLPTLAANSVHCVVTSPPYFALRDYGTATWDGGDAECDHKSSRTGGSVQRAEQSQRGLDRGYAPTSNFANYGERWTADPFRETCGKCGARRVDRQIGLEATPDEYLATMVAVFREVKRVLRPDGTLFLNIGDSYAGSSANSGGASYNTESAPFRIAGLPPKAGKPKDLMMMPARLALALQADGWWVRSDIIWHKPNPMPESVTDRPTSAYEHVFLLTKRATYFYDAEAVREVNSNPALSECVTDWRERPGNGEWPSGTGGRMGSVQSGRNCRNVWTIATQAFSESHFATMPTAVVERCIRAGTSERGCCSACGAPWRRETERSGRQDQASWYGAGRANGCLAGGGHEDRTGHWSVDATTTGWAPSCACAADVVPATVLDPFSGASTTLLVAQRLQRQAIGIELNPEYVTMGRQRIEDEAGLFADVQTLSGVQSDVEPVPGFAQADLFAEAAD